MTPTLAAPILSFARQCDTRRHLRPTSAILIEKHERQRKQEKGLHGEERGTDAAALDALGAAMGSIGLVAFAGICWWLIPRYPAPLALGGATVAWLLVSFSAWTIRQRRRRLF